MFQWLSNLRSSFGSSARREKKGSGKQERKAGTEKKMCDRVVIGLGIIEYLTDQDLNFMHQAKRLNPRVKIFKA